MSQSSPFGQRLKFWRHRRGISQLELATLLESSPRHLSFLETGRSRPRQEFVLRVADCLDIPIRERNELLIAAGVAPVFVERTLGDLSLVPYRRALEEILRRHEPYPASVFNLFGEVMLTNRASEALWPGLSGVPAEKMLDGFLASGPGRESLENFAEVAWAFTDRLQREALRTQHPRLVSLHERARAHLKDVARPRQGQEQDVLVLPLRMRIDGKIIPCFTTIMRFESAHDIALSELRVEQVFPANEEADEFFRALRPASFAHAPLCEARR